MRENGRWTQLWLKYDSKNKMGNESFFGHLRLEGFEETDVIVANALKELRAGIEGMLGISPDASEGEELYIRKATGIGKEGFHLCENKGRLCLEAEDENGLLYGIFEILRMVSVEKPLKGIDVTRVPKNPFRMYNHWDNMDGSIERGYSGMSLFFDKDRILVDERTRDYAWCVSRIGIKRVGINNVNVKNAATWLITDRYFDDLAKLSKVFAGYGIKMYLSLNFAATLELGGPDSADPLDERVIAWWREKMAEVFARIPNLGGFLVKADSEGRPGPFTYGRTQADGANMLADIVKPYGAIIIWR